MNATKLPHTNMRPFDAAFVLKDHRDARTLPTLLVIIDEINRLKAARDAGPLTPDDSLLAEALRLDFTIPPPLPVEHPESGCDE